jgi:hypothetical protein
VIGGLWVCQLCAAHGLTGRTGWERHYVEAHYELELERLDNGRHRERVSRD